MLKKRTTPLEVNERWFRLAVRTTLCLSGLTRIGLSRLIESIWGKSGTSSKHNFFFWQNYRFKVRMCRGKRPAGAGCRRLCLASDIFHQSLWENFIGKSFNLLSDKLWWNTGVYYCMRMVKSAEGSISTLSATLSGITVWFSSQESKSN